jgi:hypothetical protein
MTNHKTNMSDKSNPVVEQVVVEKPKRGRPKGKKPVDPVPVAPAKKSRKKVVAKPAAAAAAAPPAAQPEPEPVPAPVKAKAVKMSEESKTELRDFMLNLHEKNNDMSVRDGKSARMKIMSRMRKGMTAKEAWADVNQ